MKPTVTASTVPALRESHVRRIMEAAEAAQPPATRTAYSCGWTTFHTWTDREGFDPLPAAPETVAAFLTDRAADGLAPATVRPDAAAIGHVHRESGRANPCQAELVRRVLRGIGRQAAASGRKAKLAPGILGEHLAAIRATACRPRIGRVDVALVSVMRDAMLRRSKAVAIRWGGRGFPGGRVRRGSPFGGPSPTKPGRARSSTSGARPRGRSGRFSRWTPSQGARRVFGLRSGVQVFQPDPGRREIRGPRGRIHRPQPTGRNGRRLGGLGRLGRGRPGRRPVGVGPYAFALRRGRDRGPGRRRQIPRGRLRPAWTLHQVARSGRGRIR